MSTNTSPTIVSAQGSLAPESTKAPAFMILFMKMPLILYRFGLGWLLGKRFMRLTHVGRKSGKTYHTVLVALRFDELTHEIQAVSPWSESNWYRNIQAATAIEVESGSIGSGSVRFAPIQRSLTPEEIAAALMDFCKRYPIFSRMVARIPGWKIGTTYEEFLALARTLRGVAFLPKE